MAHDGRRFPPRWSLLTWFFLLSSVASTWAVGVLLTSHGPITDGSHTGGFALIGVAATAWIAFFVQRSGDKTWILQRASLTSISDELATLRDTSIPALRSAIDGLTRRTLPELEESIGRVTAESIEGVQSAMEALAQEAEKARREAQLARLMDGNDHPYFIGAETHFRDVALRPGVVLREAKLAGCIWDKVSMPNVDLTLAQLKDASFNGNLNGAILKSADLNGTTIDGSLANGTFTTAQFWCSRFVGHFRSGDFAHADMKSSCFAGSNLRDAQWNGATLEKVCFWRSALWDAVFSEISLLWCDFQWSALDDAVFTDVGGLSAGCKFRGALLQRTDFTEVTLSVLQKWSFEGALDVEAKWPAAFDPVAAGVLVQGTTPDHDFDPAMQRRLEVIEEKPSCPGHPECRWFDQREPAVGEEDVEGSPGAGSAV
jgi:uncharacterized protein YjbI with pentapeptide repeats